MNIFNIYLRDFLILTKFGNLDTFAKFGRKIRQIRQICQLSLRFSGFDLVTMCNED